MMSVTISKIPDKSGELPYPQRDYVFEDGWNAVLIPPDRWYCFAYTSDVHYTVSPYIFVGFTSKNQPDIVSKKSRVTIFWRVKSVPDSGPLEQCVSCVPFDDLLLLVNHHNQDVREYVARRFRNGV